MVQKLPRGFNEYWYLKLNSDVKIDIIKGNLASGEQHYLLYGFKENRKYKKPLFYNQKRKFINFHNKNKVRYIGKNNILECDAELLKNVNILINGNNNRIIIKAGTVLNKCTIVMEGDNHYLEIGYCCNFTTTNFSFEDHDCNIIIRDNTTVTELVDFRTLEPYSEICVGEDCMFSSFTELRTSDSHTIYDIDTNKRENYAKNIIIGNHVWIGAHSNILKGSVIPDNCIIAMRSMVTKKFDEPNCVIGGLPAKILNRNRNWKRERTYD